MDVNMSNALVFPDGSFEPWAKAKLDVRECQRLAAYIEKVCGIRIPPSKQILIESRLRRRLRALDMGDFHEYCEYVLASEAGLDEVVHMVDEITTNKTDFFREPFHFDYLTSKAIPDLRRQHGGLLHDISVWSAACSSGEEPYTLGMVLAEYAANHPGFRYSILGTDICTDVLEQARRGVYFEDQIDPVPFLYREKYLMRSKDRYERLVRVSPQIRMTVRLRRLNFLDPDYRIDERMDVIFCRNVFIYFSRETQEAVCNRICSHLRKGGYFFVGHAESLQGMALPLRLVSPSIYQKVE
jgi:chemotaxis protein methyltransferase CheR